MEAQTFLDNFGTIAQAPGGIDQLRQLVLNLAVLGWLVEQEPGEEGADPLLSRMQALRDGLVDAGVINRPRHPSGVPVSDPPCELPDGWAWSRLGDISAIVGGGTPKSTDPSFWSDEPAVPWLTPADMRGQESRYASSGSRDISELGLEKSSAQLLPKGSVLFSSRAPIGHVAIASRPLATNQGFKSSVQYEPEMSEYICVFLRKVGPEIDENATGTTFKEVNAKEVSLIPVPVPPLAEQHRIVAKVDELMALCDQLETEQQTRTQTATKLRASALGALTTAETADDLQTAWERIHTNWEAMAPGVDSVAGIRDMIRELAIQGQLSSAAGRSENDLLTESSANGDARPSQAKWQILPLSELLVDGLSNGWSPKGVDYVTEVKSLKLSATTSGFFDGSKVKYLDVDLDPSSRYWLQTGDLLIQRSNTPKYVGIAAIYNGPPNQFIYPDLMMRGRVRETHVAEYVHLALLAPSIRNNLRTQATGTSETMVKLSQRTTLQLSIPVPSRSKQEQIARKVSELMGLCDELETRLVERDRLGEALAASVVEAFAA